jgi:predicted nuclease of predicted toxin-antitoxin system
MMINFYFDEMLNRSLANELAKHGYTVIMANDIEMTGKSDEEHLAEATKRGLVLVTLDKPFAGRTTQRSDHMGLVCWTPTDQTIGAMVRALTEFAKQNTSEQVTGQVFWLK